MDQEFIAPLPRQTALNICNWTAGDPLLEKLRRYQEVTWYNPDYQTVALPSSPLLPKKAEITEAAARFSRFRDFFAAAFPETAPAGGTITSPLVAIPQMQQALASAYQTEFSGRLLLKCDHLLPIAGSIKARGGFHEVLCQAEKIALAENLLSPGENTSRLGSTEARHIFSRYRLAVGSTGNLGLAIGILGARFGFTVTVHMAAAAKSWKKKLLRGHGIEVVEYQADYSLAVAAGRRQAADDASCHFVDDENSTDLFLGYAVAAAELAGQLAEAGVNVDADHPLHVHLPCGVGGAPGGVTFGLKHLFAGHVHCWFAEPTHSPCMLLGLYTGLHEKIAVRDLGLDNQTVADGLAVGRPSGLVGRLLSPVIAGAYTVDDQHLLRQLVLLQESEKIALEPSALAGMVGIVRLHHEHDASRSKNFSDREADATHVVWATGGGMVPPDEHRAYSRLGKSHF
ncbi:MAG: D-serine ammonia-lyase [Desulforhopalus sp.]|jgi:D-serine dehydratase|nr:D-serine ammonia-lyase [Desulforhopalus sp.]